jgi:WD40 repeat protein
VHTDITFNPFPGLRSFEPDEEHLFFGRERQIENLLRRLRSTRFLAVVGASGSGKSSLVRSGLIPALYSGHMARAGSSWRIALMRPGGDPIGNLAAALDEPAVVGAAWVPNDMHRPMVEATLRRSALGVAETVRHARLAGHDNVLIVVDQFEELFRFRQARGTLEARDEAVAFVKLLVEAVHDETARTFVVLTMRSEFIGNCTQFADLPAAVNEGQYLVPRMTRDELTLAITGPVAVGGGEIAPRLVTRLLNDVGDDPDHLPLLQHALMRTWDYWAAHRTGAAPIDLAHYEAIGTMRHALSQHADEAYGELATSDDRQTCERMFKSLVEMTPQAGGVRRPCRVAELVAISEMPEHQVVPILERFRRPGRSFLMPPHDVPLQDSTIVDLSHESLIRLWDRLVAWTADEAKSADFYKRLSQAAELHERGEAALWRDPELQLALNWRDSARPVRAWAERYDVDFDAAMAFLDRSRAARDQEIADRQREVVERRRLRRRQLIFARVAAAMLSVLCVVSIVSLVIARRARDEALAQQQVADVERREAESQRGAAQRLAAQAQQSQLEAQQAEGEALQAEREALQQRTVAQRAAEEASVAAQAAQAAAIAQAASAKAAEEAAQKAQAATVVAQDQSQLAQQQTELAMERQKEATEATARAVAAGNTATRLQRLALSRALAGEAVQQAGTPDVRALLARQAFNLAATTEGGDPESPEIITALRQSLENIAPDSVRLFVGHRDAVRAVAVSPSGQALATGGDDGEVRLYRIGGPANVPRIVGTGMSPVRSIAFDAGGNLLVAGTFDGSIHVWRLTSTGDPSPLPTRWNGHGQAVNHLAFDSGNNLVSVGFDGEVRVWGAGNFDARPSAWVRQSGRLVAAALSHTGNRLAVAVDSGGVLVGALAEGSPPPQLLQDARRVTAVGFSSDDRWIVAGTAEGRLLYWDLMSPGGPVRETPAHRAQITAVQFGGGLLATAGLDGELRVRGANVDAANRPPLILAHGAWIWNAAFNRAGDLAFSAGADGRVRGWPTSARLMADEICRRVTRKNLDQAEWNLFMTNLPYASVCPETLADGRRQ